MKNKIKLLTLAALAALALTLASCSSTNTQQIVNSTSGDGMLAKIAVPAGQSTSIGASLFVGRFNNSTIVQPTSTNGVVHAPNLAVTVYGSGKQGDSGSVGGTNSGTAAGITDGSRDLSAIITGESTAAVATGTNQAIKIGQ